ncbi:hypothetical protein [Paenibacillus senegalensis]|uniref:hypothetical protein n=1 Tax=Paenibacillus senegalensis TaxID=1465766 RepID=UPI00028927A9|nr:hypothetical protein [Paenibacillus senegalensis]
MNVILWILGSIAAVVIIFVAAAGTYAVLKERGNELYTRRDENGNLILLDTPSMRIGAASAYDQTIEMEKRGHVNSNGMSWNDRWLGTIRSIRKSTENPEWYVQYIIEQRRKAGLPELEGVDEAWP